MLAFTDKAGKSSILRRHLAMASHTIICGLYLLRTYLLEYVVIEAAAREDKQDPDG